MIKELYQIYGFILNFVNHINFTFYNFLNLKNSFPRKNFLKLKNIKSNKIVIFGSSKSILNLTKKEKEILKHLPKVFMNKNLIYWKKINLWPEFYFLLDTPIKSKSVKNIFFETLKILKSNNKTLPILLLEKFYSSYTPVNIEKYYFNYNKSINLKWANKNKETLFGSHGSITSLLNVISLFQKFKYIILIGVDFNQAGYFFSDKEKNYYQFVEHEKDKLEKKRKLHSNLIKVNDVDILTFWPLINKKLKKKRIKLYCASKQSELVKKKLVKYKSIKEFNNL